MLLAELAYGDSLHLPAARDILPILRWAFSGLPGFEPSPSQTHITPGLIDRQQALAGGGSCGIAATNFIECRAGLGLPRWRAAQSAEFRNIFLRDLLLYHLIARKKTSSYTDWVTPCSLNVNGEVPGLTDEAVGYNDFNLDMLTLDVRFADTHLYSCPNCFWTSVQSSHLRLGGRHWESTQNSG
ncbi:hypothetical protein K438DRAFT_1594204 [Mycena galopus ATCC 62051]|nr:hypothetical protein K438DRAFT_1594204 [Mycena galopus ATCC 62051]